MISPYDDSRRPSLVPSPAVLNGPRGVAIGKSSRINTNSYATKKTISQGMFDVALLTANASQLKRVLTLGDRTRFYILMLILIGVSILLQVLVGVLFIYLGYHNLDKEHRQKDLNKLNNVTTIIVFIITVINVFIAGFGINSEHDLND